MLIFCLLISFLIHLSCTYVHIDTYYGRLKGVPSLVAENVTEFLGVPYALPPIGPLRFKKAKPLTFHYYGREFNANKYAKACIQVPNKIKFKGFDGWYPEEHKMSEDCLQLNIWVPKDKTGAVIVFLFGGEYTYGSSSLEYYDGSALANTTGAIVVNVNYRLGVFGFAYFHPDEKDGIPGNLGLLDQQLALRWVRDNIANFGGNPKKVTLFGQGSGSAMATAHLYAPGSSHLFRRIIASSGTIHHKSATAKNYHVHWNFQELIERLKCNDGTYREQIICMQNVTAAELALKASSFRNPLQYFTQQTFVPVDKDNIFFYGNLTTFYRRKGFVKWNVDLIIGRTEDEASLYMVSNLHDDIYNCKLDYNHTMTSVKNQCNMTPEGYNYIVKLIMINEELTNQSFIPIRKVYRKFGGLRNRTLRVLSDFVYNCDSSEFAHVLKKEEMGNVYYYNFRKRSVSNPWPKWMGAMHRYDLLYIFGYPFTNPDYYNKTKDLKTEEEISLKIMSVIGGFVTYGNITREIDNFNLSKCGNEFCKNIFDLGKFNLKKFDKIGTCSDVTFIRKKYKIPR